MIELKRLGEDDPFDRGSMCNCCHGDAEWILRLGTKDHTQATRLCTECLNRLRRQLGDPSV